MATIVCTRCGGLTNTAASEYLDHWLETGVQEAVRCFLRWEEGRWVKGCGYDELPEDSLEKQFADRVLGGQ